MGSSENGFENSEFVRVRISSFLMSILLFSLRPLRSLRLNVFSAPAHERAQPAPAVHPRSSRAGGMMEIGEMQEECKAYAKMA